MKKFKSYLGKKILVGLTYMNQNGEVNERFQLYGPIKKITKTTLIFERSDGGGNFSIPFIGELEEADEEVIYILKSNGEKVTGVSYVVSFDIYPPRST